MNVFSFLDPRQLRVVSLSGVVHLTGGVAGLAGTTILGPRKGRFTNPEEFECHNLPLVVLGTFYSVVRMVWLQFRLYPYYEVRK